MSNNLGGRKKNSPSQGSNLKTHIDVKKGGQFVEGSSTLELNHIVVVLITACVCVNTLSFNDIHFKPIKPQLHSWVLFNAIRSDTVPTEVGGPED